VADFDKVIPPGQEGKVNIRIDAKKLSNAAGFEKNFTVRTNDPQRKQFVLVVHGTVKKAFEFSNEMNWSGFVDGTMKVENVITSLLSTPVNITGVRWGDDGKAKGLDEKIGLALETIERGRKYRLTIWNKKGLSPDNIAAHVILTTDHAKLKEKSLPITITVLRDVEARPDRIYATEMVVPAGAKKTFDHYFTVFAARGDSLRILKAVSNRDDMTVKIQEVQRGKSYRGTITIRPKSAIAQYLGSVKIYTNYPGYRELAVDVVGSVRQAEQ